MNACELTESITAIANWLACQLGQDELELLGVSLTQLGDTLLAIAVQKSICCKVIDAAHSMGSAFSIFIKAPDSKPPSLQ